MKRSSFVADIQQTTFTVVDSTSVDESLVFVNGSLIVPEMTAAGYSMAASLPGETTLKFVSPLKAGTRIEVISQI